MGYPPYGYNPYQTNMQVPNLQPQPQAQQVTDSWVMTEDEVKNFRVMPNCTVRLWHMNEPVFWVKQADAMGHPTTRKFSYTEDTSENPVPVTRAEFEDLVAKVNKLVAPKTKKEEKE